MVKNITASITVSDMILARLALNPAEMLDNVVCHQTGQYIKKLCRIEEKLEELKQPVIDVLFRAVPLLKEDKNLMRRAIHLKRDVFNDREDRLAKIDLHQYTEIVKRSNAADRKTMALWLSYREQKRNIESEIDKVFQQEKREMIDRLVQYLHDGTLEEFMKGLSLASLELVESLQKSTKALQHFGSNLSKSIFMYLQRSVIKTSPFSTFTQVNTTAFTGEPAARRQCLEARSVIRLNRAILNMIIQAMAKHEKLSHLFKFRVAEQANAGGQTVRITGRYMFTDNFFWKTEEFKGIRQSQLLSAFTDLKEDQTYQIQEVLGSYQNNNDYLRNLLFSQKLIIPVVPFSQNESEPLKKLAEMLSASKVDDQTAHMVAEILTASHQWFLKLHDASAAERLVLLKRLRSELKKLFRVLGSQPPQWIDQANLVFEDVRSEIEVPHLGEKVRQDIEELTKLVKPYMMFSSLYEQILNTFKNLYGHGATVNLLDFLATLTSDEQLYYRIVGLSNMQDMQKATGKPFKGPNIAPPTVCAYFQICADHYEDVLQGRYLLVVNKIHTGIGNVLARFQPLLFPRSSENPLKDWVEGLFPSSRTAEWAMGGDWSNLQEHFRVLPDTVDWIGEMKYGSTAHQMKRMQITHCPATDTLVIKNEAGDVMTPVYLGTVPQYLIQGPGKILLSLVNPWLIDAPFGINPRPWERIEDTDEILFLPRIQVGRIVLKRAQWIISTKWLSSLIKSEREWECMKNMQKFLDKYKMPVEMFLHIVDTRGTMQRSKPIWLHFHNPHSLEILKKILHQDCGHLILTEALPSHQTGWITNKDGKKVVSEFMSLSKIDFE
jgi:uncharacterized protein (UPF0335 family)